MIEKQITAIFQKETFPEKRVCQQKKKICENIKTAGSLFFELETIKREHKYLFCVITYIGSEF